MSTTNTKVPSIPAVPKNEREATAFNNSIKEALEVRLGRRGDPKDRAVTLRELIDSGMAKELLDNPFDPNAGTGVTDFASSSTFVDGKLDDTNDLTAPPTPTGLSASAGTTKIVLSWNFTQISNLAHTEVWRSSDSSLGNAVRHDTTEAFVWVDSVDPGEQYYYWVRHVTTAGIFSPFAGSVNATGVLIAGTKIANDAITETKIADDAITTPKILTNAVTADSIAGNTITAANIAANELTSASGIFGTLDASEMTITNLNATNISAGTLNANRLNLNGSTLSVSSNGLQIATAGVTVTQIGNFAAGHVAHASSGGINISANSDYTYSNYIASTPYAEYNSTYISDDSDGHLVLELDKANIAETGDYLQEFVIVPSGTIPSSGTVETAMIIQHAYSNSSSLSGASWTNYNYYGTGSRTGTAGHQLAPIYYNVVTSLNSSQHQRWVIWLHFYGWSGSFGINNASIKVFRINKGGSM